MDYVYQNRPNTIAWSSPHEEEIPDCALWIAILHEKWDEVRSLLSRSRTNGRKDALRLVKYNDRALLTASWNGAPIDVVQQIYALSPQQAFNLDDIQVHRLQKYPSMSINYSHQDSYQDLALATSENESINCIYELMKRTSGPHTGKEKILPSHSGRRRKRSHYEI